MQLGCYHSKSRPRYSCTSSWVRSDVSFSAAGTRSSADCGTVGSPLADPGSNSCFVLSSNQFLWVNWLVLLVGEGGELRQITGFFHHSSGFQLHSPSLSPSPTGLVCPSPSRARPSLKPLFTARAGNDLPLIKLICRDGSSLCPRHQPAI